VPPAITRSARLPVASPANLGLSAIHCQEF